MKLPTMHEAKANYDTIVKLGGMVEALPAVEQLILKFSPISIFARWAFRRQLLRLLKDNDLPSKNEAAANQFVERFAPANMRYEFTGLLLRAMSHH